MRTLVTLLLLAACSTGGVTGSNPPLPTSEFHGVAMKINGASFVVDSACGGGVFGFGLGFDAYGSAGGVSYNITLGVSNVSILETGTFRVFRYSRPSVVANVNVITPDGGTRFVASSDLDINAVGTITVTMNTAEKVAGTFAFRAFPVDSGGTVFNVSDGRFDLTRLPVPTFRDSYNCR